MKRDDFTVDEFTLLKDLVETNEPASNYRRADVEKLAGDGLVETYDAPCVTPSGLATDAWVRLTHKGRALMTSLGYSIPLPIIKHLSTGE